MGQLIGACTLLACMHGSLRSLTCECDGNSLLPEQPCRLHTRIGDGQLDYDARVNGRQIQAHTVELPCRGAPGLQLKLLRAQAPGLAS